jgi:uncharacterized protein
LHPKAKNYINKLELIPHPEGGYFKEYYRADEKISFEGLPERYTNARSFHTSIYFLLEGSQISSLHKLKSDEIWHHYDGCSLMVHIIDENGMLHKILVGKNIDKGESPQIVVRKDCWFGAELTEKNSFALIGCGVSPGFEFDDFELGKRQELLKLYPGFKETIIQLTDEQP